MTKIVSPYLLPTTTLPTLAPLRRIALPTLHYLHYPTYKEVAASEADPPACGKGYAPDAGECAPSPCPEHAAPASHPECACRKGYEGELAWTGAAYEGSIRILGDVSYNASVF